MPNNETEAKEIQAIIIKMKKYSLPTLAAGGVAILGPDFFEIKVSNPFINSMMEISNVVLTSLSINYSADGNMQMMVEDGMPKHIILSLTFKDREMLYSKAN
jgi:hypothetical protein